MGLINWYGIRLPGGDALQSRFTAGDGNQFGVRRGGLVLDCFDLRTALKTVPAGEPTGYAEFAQKTDTACSRHLVSL